MGRQEAAAATDGHRRADPVPLESIDHAARRTGRAPALHPVAIARQTH